MIMVVLPLLRKRKKPLVWRRKEEQNPYSEEVTKGEGNPNLVHDWNPILYRKAFVPSLSFLWYEQKRQKQNQRKAFRARTGFLYFHKMPLSRLSLYFPDMPLWELLFGFPMVDNPRGPIGNLMKTL